MVITDPNGNDHRYARSQAENGSLVLENEERDRTRKRGSWNPPTSTPATEKPERRRSAGDVYRVKGPTPVHRPKRPTLDRPGPLSQPAPLHQFTAASSPAKTTSSPGMTSVRSLGHYQFGLQPPETDSLISDSDLHVDVDELSPDMSPSSGNRSLKDSFNKKGVEVFSASLQQQQKQMLQYYEMKKALKAAYLSGVQQERKKGSRRPSAENPELTDLIHLTKKNEMQLKEMRQLQAQIAMQQQALRQQQEAFQEQVSRSLQEVLHTIAPVHDFDAPPCPNGTISPVKKDFPAEPILLSPCANGKVGPKSRLPRKKSSEMKWESPGKWKQDAVNPLSAPHHSVS
jgi:DNA-binding transcriptional MerR regulator